MKFGILLDPLEDIKIQKDSTYAMAREAASRGHELFVFHQEDLTLRDGHVYARSRELKLQADPHHWYSTGEPSVTALVDFDCTLMRKDPPVDMEYIHTLGLLEVAEAQGARVINRPAAIRDHNEKLAILKFPELIAPTLVTRDVRAVRQFVVEHQDAILKPLDGMGGSGIFRASASDGNLNVIIETLAQHGARTVMAQRYIPEIAQGDKRVFIIDGEALPFSLARIPQRGDHRGNLAAGGIGVGQPLSDRDLEIAQRLSSPLNEAGLVIVGIDIIGPYLTEINVTCPTLMQEIYRETGFDVAARAVDAIERYCTRDAPARLRGSRVAR
jgi:glutathione synthase